MSQHNNNTSTPSILVTAALWFFLGLIGAHRFYLGKYKSGLIMLCLFLGLLFFAFIPANFPQLYSFSEYWSCMNNIHSLQPNAVISANDCTGGSASIAYYLYYIGLAFFIILPIWWVVDISLLAKLLREKPPIAGLEVHLKNK